MPYSWRTPAKNRITKTISSYFNLNASLICIMKRNSLAAVVALTILLSACSSSPSYPPPPAAKVTVKPVAKNTAKQPDAAQPRPNAKGSGGTATYPIESVTKNFKDEQSLPTLKVEPLAAVTPPASQPNPVAGTLPSLTNPPGGMLSPQSMVKSPSAGVENQPAALNLALEDAVMPAGSSQAVVALVGEAERNRNKGDLDAAVGGMERALLIDSRNPTITYKLALLRLKQSKPQLAEELAGKAALLAAGDGTLKRKCWLLIAEARQQQHNYQGAKQAKTKAESFFGH
jgi:hypothetical protein